jgi:hypothetical protein
VIKLTFLPPVVRAMFKAVPGIWKARHLLVLQWLVLMQAVYPGKKTLKELSRYCPSRVPEWRMRRLLKASYWSVHLLVSYFAREVMDALPEPGDRALYLAADGSHKDKRGKKNPVAQKGRESDKKPFFFGIRFALISANWESFRIPCGFRIVLPKKHPDYKKENALFREMLEDFVPPSWAEKVVVIGDAGLSSKENMRKVEAIDKADSSRDWRFVFAVARTWKTEDGKSLKNLVAHLPLKYCRRTWVPSSFDPNRRKTFWIYGKTVRLRHVGDVTVVISKKRRNAGPKATKILVTNLPNATARQVVSVYQRRWSIEIIFKELKSGLGLGEHQVSAKENRVENSVGIAVLSYLFLLNARRADIRPGRPWSIFQLQNNLRMEVIRGQMEHSFDLKLKKILKAA